MIDKQRRLTLKRNLVSRTEIGPNATIILYYNPLKNVVVIREDDNTSVEEEYFVTSVKLNTYRMQFPIELFKCFSKVNLLPTEKNGTIYIWIMP